MKYFSTLLLVLAGSATLVAAMPNKVAHAARAAESVNVAANNGDKGIAAADLAQEAVDLAEAGDGKFYIYGPLFLKRLHLSNST